MQSDKSPGMPLPFGILERIGRNGVLIPSCDFEKILNILDKINKEDKMLILSSDHWYRLKDQNNAHPILFATKILSENNKIEISEPDSAIYIQELIYKYLLKEISTYSDIKKFFEEKPFHKTYISQ